MLNENNLEKIKEIKDRIALLESRIQNKSKIVGVKSSQSSEPFVAHDRKKWLIVYIIFSLVVIFAMGLTLKNFSPIQILLQKNEAKSKANWLSNEETNDIIRSGQLDVEKRSSAYQMAQKDLEKAIETSNRTVAAHKAYGVAIEKIYKVLRENGFSHEEAMEYIKERNRGL